MSGGLRLDELPVAEEMKATDLLLYHDLAAADGQRSSQVTLGTLFSNVPSPVTLKPPMDLTADGAQGRFLTMDAGSSHEDFAPWIFGVQRWGPPQGSSDPQGMHNYTQGMNVTPSMNPANPASAGYAWRAELHWENPVGRIHDEFHLISVNTAGNQHRVFSTEFLDDDQTSTGVEFRSRDVFWHDGQTPSALRAKFDWTTDQALWVGLSHNMASNNIAALRQRNAADSAFIEIARVDDDDRIALGRQGPHAGILVQGDLLLGTSHSLRMADPAAGLLFGTVADPVQNVTVRGASTEVFRWGDPSGGLYALIAHESAMVFATRHGTSRDPLWIGATAPTNALRLQADRAVFGVQLDLAEQNLTTDTTTGTRIGTATTQKLGFFGATPVARPTIDTADAASIIAALVALGLVEDDT